MSLLDVPRDLFYFLTSFMCHRSLCTFAQVNHQAEGLINERAWEICFAVQFRNHKYVDPSRLNSLLRRNERNQEEDLPLLSCDPLSSASPLLTSATLTSEEEEMKVSSQTVDWKRLYRTTQQSILLFNRDPNIWEEFWFENNNPLPNNSHAPSVAQFLFANIIALNKSMLNSYITTSSAPHRREILRAFVALFDFRGVLFEWALRMFVAIVWLPRSSKAIDRLLHCFSDEYCIQNPKMFRDTDAVYALCFSLMMLSTDLHNPGVKTKITSKQWISSNDGVVDTGASVSMMMTIYESVRLCPVIWELASVKQEGWLEMAVPPREGKLTNLVDTGVQELSKRIPGRFSRVFSQLLPHAVYCTLQDGVFCAYDSPKMATVVLRLELKEPGKATAYNKPRLESSSSEDTSDSEPETNAQRTVPKMKAEKKKDAAFPRNPTFADHNLLPGEVPHKSRLPIAIHHHGNRHLFWALTQADRDHWLPALHYNIHAEQHGLLRFARFVS